MRNVMVKNGVLIVEDHMIVRTALIYELQKFPDFFQVVGEARDADTALSMAVSLKPQIIFLDHTLAQSTGLQILEELKKLDLNFRIVVFTQSSNPHILRTYWESNVVGLLGKSSDLDDLHQALKALMIGKRYISKDFEDLIFSSPEKLLSKRELEVVLMVAKGLSNKQVAGALNCSDQTIKTHKANIMRKLGFNNSVELSVWASENGIF